MTARSPTSAEILLALSERIQGEINVCLPGKIESYDASKQLASVKPLLKRPLINEDGTDADAESVPVISNVPVVHPSGGGYFTHFPLAQGDPVILIFADRSIDRWLDRGGEVDPGFTHTHELTDAIAIPGGRAQPQKLQNPSSSKLTIGKDGDASMQITIDGTVIKLSDNATDFVALAQKVLTELQKITTYLTAISAVWGSPIPEAGMGAPSALGTALNAAHLAAGGVPSMQSVAASKVKAE